MLLALICLWIGFAVGLVCAAVMRESSHDIAPRRHVSPSQDYVI